MEERCTVAMEALNNRIAREYEQLASTLAKELQRARNNHNAEKERKVHFKEILLLFCTKINCF